MGNLPCDLKLFLGADFAEAVHRIDVPVTGCVLFALTADALAFLNAAFAGDKAITGAAAALPVEKKYWAILEKPAVMLPENLKPCGELVHWVETNSRLNKSFAYNDRAPGRKKASLKYRIAGEGKNYLFAEVQLLSGKHHQIRAQFAAIGLHIKGDLKYGAKRSEKDGGIRLHARSLSFPNPLKTSEKICATAVPPQMDNLWEAFSAAAL